MRSQENARAASAEARSVSEEELGVKREELGVKREELGVKREALGVKREELGVKREALGVQPTWNKRQDWRGLSESLCMSHIPRKWRVLWLGSDGSCRQG